MPRYFFRVCDGPDCEAPEGIELADLQSAHEEAIRRIRSILADEVRVGRLPLKGRIEVKDEAGGVALHVGFREALQIEN